MQNENIKGAISIKGDHETTPNAVNITKIHNAAINAIGTNDINNINDTINADNVALISAADTIKTSYIIASASNSFSKKIGRTMYTVQIFFSKTSRETFNDKILRLIKNDVVNETKEA